LSKRLQSRTPAKADRFAFELVNAANLAEWSGGVWTGGLPPSIEGVCIDTRQLRPGDLFFALPGEKRDGHQFVGEAFRKGASGAVVDEHKVSGPDAVTPCLRVRDPATALRAMAVGYRRALNPRVVGITGSAGKSTVKEMTAAMLAARYHTGSTRGNWNNDIGLPLSLLSMDTEVEVAVIEMGTNHPGEIGVLCELAEPECGIVTNIGPVHTEYFGSLAAIAKEKSTLLRRLPRSGVAVLNRDSEHFDFLSTTVGCELKTVSFHADADYQCLRWNPAAREALVLERDTGEEAVLNMPLPGDFNVVNALLAAAVARWMGVPWSGICEAIRMYRGLPLRWQEIEVNGLNFINDSYNANPMNMRASIGAFGEEVKKAGKWLLLGGMLELGEREKDEHLSLGRFVGAGGWAGLIVVGDLGSLIADGAGEAGFPEERIFRCPDCDGAVAVIRREVAPSSSILLKGSRRFQLERIVEKSAAVQEGDS